MDDAGTDTRPEREAPRSRALAIETRARAFFRRLRRLLLQRLPPEEARDVRRSVEAEGQLTERFILMSGLSAGIATLGLLQSSAAVVIGAMLVSPLMSPIAALGFGFASLDARRIQAAARVVLIGALVGVGVGMMLTWASPIRNATPEIIARTAPTLLDLAVAVLSGFAGGYATVHRRGETAIGVAIATALMPPLATLGYSLAVLRFDFAAGAGLLFLTNLAAIAFSFAIVARLRGVARPLARVEFKPFHMVLGAIAFLVLATPLGLTLRRVTQEALASSTARTEIAHYFGIDANQIAQLQVAWSNLSAPKIAATVVTPEYRTDADEQLTEVIGARLKATPDLELNQIVAADTQAQTQAMINAALAQQGRQVSAPAPPPPPPPIEAARKSADVPVTAAWADEDAKTIHLSASLLDGMKLADLRLEEQRLANVWSGWTVQIIPPFRERLFVPFPTGLATPDYDTLEALKDARWALERWGVTHVGLEGLAGRNTARSRSLSELALARAQATASALSDAGLEMDAVVASAATTAALFAQGGDERTTGVDIKVLRAPR
ncbi:MAG: DUF389 domain-containing protein [Hyphomonadaceae bacterium]